MPRYAQYDKSFNGYRLFIGNIGERVGKYDLEAEFDKFGPLIDIWVARFVVSVISSLGVG